MAEPRRGAGERLENLDLHGGIGDMILAADDVRDAEVDVVDHRGKGVEISSVLAPQHRVGERSAIDMALAAHHVVPAHRRRVEAETPMRPAARRFERGAFGVAQAQGRAVVDRRAAQRLLALAPPLEFLPRLVRRIQPAQRFEFLGRFVISRHALRLPMHAIGRDSEPVEILFDRFGVFGFRAVEIGVVEAQDERPSMPAGVEPVEQRRAGVANVDAPGRRRREADDRRRGHSLS